MELDYYADYYRRQRMQGKDIELVEDDTFDVDQIISAVEASEGEPPDDWESVSEFDDPDISDFD
ncbi:MAG: hypothetical protein MUF20_03180 [Methylotetracoccus sp.]|jgi:hypothetical protein|nr:hypothetical protein [Methylotetracoccus sp.]